MNYGVGRELKGYIKRREKVGFARGQVSGRWSRYRRQVSGSCRGTGGNAWRNIGVLVPPAVNRRFFYSGAADSRCTAVGAAVPGECTVTGVAVPVVSGGRQSCTGSGALGAVELMVHA